MKNNQVTVIGAGMAGCEAAWQLVKRGIPVKLIEMKPVRRSAAHTGDGFAELVCSNSLKAENLTSGSGLLKAEMKLLGSLLLECAEKARVPAGGALAVDRDIFSAEATKALREHPLVEVEIKAVEEIPEGPAIIATGPLTDAPLAEAIRREEGADSLYFFDAAAPIVTAESLDEEKIFRASRYGKGDGDDYINCPMDEETYRAFYDALTTAERADVHGFEKKMVFEGCLPVEVLADRGFQTLAFGPMKPVGLVDPRTGKEPYAVVQLRRENAEGTLYNLVGFQTRLKWGEQKRVFSMIPGLEKAEFARYGVMHRNTYLNGPQVLDKNFVWKKHPDIRFAGQMTGVEGYMESAASGMVAGLNMARKILGQNEVEFGGKTIIGALEKHTRTPNENYQPMNSNFGILDRLSERVKGKRNRYEKMAEVSLAEMKRIIEENGI
ncbi:MAG: methylenetetrahydrofolate--tRNA-(uracil(54)-C(5))-methyltransferase (FADH(2)-oxidizing) TrmFO [Clostridia bacterium]|nr:methylenetetrahydrofolate--tRNA-(uracil(54)-C(5))-methyltransferase (FADH(2)-oxidizing) TrmFO [Clostridia bacterium]